MTIALPEHWLQAGDSSRPPLVLLHGFLGSAADWGPLIFALSDQWRCLAPDLPGHGRNPSDACDFAAASDQVLSELAASGIASFGVLGYSMGARLALYLLARHPGRVLCGILESGSPGLADPDAREARRDQDAALATTLLSVPLEDFLRRWYAQPLFAGLTRAPGFEALLARRRRNDPARLARSLREAGTGTAPPLWDELPGIKQPLLYLAGEQDAKFRGIGEAMAARCPSLRLRVLPGGHCPHHEAPDAWLAAVRDFLAPEGPGGLLAPAI